jgi:hypothetical protein
MHLSVESMSTAEKIDAMEALWASLCADPHSVESPAWHGELLAERRKRLASGQSKVNDWEDAKRRLRELGQ